MKISELIAELEKLKEAHGDIFVITHTDKMCVVEAFPEYRVRPDFDDDLYPLEYIDI